MFLICVLRDKFYLKNRSYGTLEIIFVQFRFDTVRATEEAKKISLNTSMMSAYMREVERKIGVPKNIVVSQVFIWLMPNTSAFTLSLLSPLLLSQASSSVFLLSSPLSSMLTICRKGSFPVAINGPPFHNHLRIKLWL